MAELNAQDKDWIRLTARELAFQAIKETLSIHIQSCPHGMAMIKAKWLIIGVSIGPMLVGGGAGFALAKLFASM